MNRVVLDRQLGQIGISQAQFARQIGISPSHLSMILNGTRTPSLAVASRIAKAAGMPLEVLFSGAA